MVAGAGEPLTAAEAQTLNRGALLVLGTGEKVDFLHAGEAVERAKFTAIFEQEFISVVKEEN